MAVTNETEQTRRRRREGRKRRKTKKSYGHGALVDVNKDVLLYTG